MDHALKFDGVKYSADARKDGHIIRACYAPHSPAPQAVSSTSDIYHKRVPSFVVAVTPGREFMEYPGKEQAWL